MNDHAQPARDAFKRAFQLLDKHLQREAERPVADFAPPAELAARLDVTLPEGEGRDLDAVFDRLDQVLDATPRSTTTRFFNQLFSGRDPVAVAGEILASAINTSMYTYKAAGPHALIERALTDHMCKKLAFHNGEGVLAPGGSLANFCAMLMARDRAVPTYKDHGPPPQPLTLYTSNLCHYSIPKNANMMGVGRHNVRRIETDHRGRMLPDALDRAIQQDLDHGAIPFFINATAGTTVLGAFDPIDPIADVAHKHDLWLHIDGCLGASAVLSTEHRHLLDGVHRADSVCWNAHKAMGVPLSCSAILTRERGLLFDTFNQTATYLFQSDEDQFNMGTMSIQCGRRNDALKLFAAWLHHGDAGYDRRITHLFDLARHAADIVRQDPHMTLSKDPESMTVCFEVDGKPSDDLCERLRRDGLEVVGFAHVDRRRVIRLACLNADATTDDIDRFFHHLRQVAADCPGGDNAVDSSASAAPSDSAPTTVATPRGRGAQ